MNCPDRAMLTLRYHADFRVYWAAQQSLSLSIGPTFPEALQRANRARLVFERSRDRLNEHINSHHCLAGTQFYTTAG